MKKFLLIITTFIVCSQAFAAEQPDWKKIIESVKSSVVMIEIEALGKLENEEPGCYQATGFVVDSEKGIILTNRHVVGVSPTIARATFLNKEKIEVNPVYYDPLHDFGFYKYNPSLLKWIKPKAMKLADSSKVKIGEEIRVLGNNASEGFSILEGTVSWIKKNAPSYSDPDTYRDFNTYYFQTSADVSGGSSGGPIINRKGEVIALNSSSKKYTTVSWGLPINLVKHTLQSLKKNKPIERGFLGARVIFSPFNELSDYGFPSSLINKLKKENGEIEGLLTVLEAIPGTDANKHLMAADVIWEINGRKIRDDFGKYERILNSNVSKEVTLTIIREGHYKKIPLHVLDLEKLKSKSYVRIGGDHFSNVPIFMAFTYNTALTGVFTPEIKYNFSERTDFPDFLVITELCGQKIFNVDDFFQGLKKIGDGQEIKLKYTIIKEQHRNEEKVFKADWKWFGIDYFRYNEKNHEWAKIF